MLTIKQQRKMCAYLKDVATSFLGGREVDVYYCKRTDDVGITSRDIIVLGVAQRYVSKLQFEDRIRFYAGVFAHELMHQLLTKFDLQEKRIKSLPEDEYERYYEIYNTLEDYAVDFQSYKYISGTLLRNLHFSRSVLYRAIAPVNQYKSAFYQYVNAFIQYKLGGAYKGFFTSIEAEECYEDTADLWYKARKTESFEDRLKIVDVLFERTKPMWNDISRSSSSPCDDCGRCYKKRKVA